MHSNLEKRFIRLAVAQMNAGVHLECFRIRYHVLFDAMAIDIGWDREYLGNYLGFGPVPSGGNSIMNGEAEPSNEDIAKLLERMRRNGSCGVCEDCGTTSGCS